MQQVFVTKRGHVYHASRDCEWLWHGKKTSSTIGRRVHPTKAVPLDTIKRKPCGVCVPCS